MLDNNLQISMQELFTKCKTLQLAYIDFLSLKYPLKIDTLFEFRYHWNYNLLRLNEKIDPTLRSIIISLRTEFYPNDHSDRGKEDFNKDFIKDTIDCIYKVWHIFNDKEFKNLLNVYEELPTSHLLKIRNGENYWEFLGLLIRELIDKELYDFSNQDFFLIQDISKEMQQHLPFDESFLIVHSDELIWDLINRNDHITWSNRTLSTFKDKVDWRKLSRNNHFTREQLLKFSDMLSWSELASNYKINWDYASFAREFYEKFNKYDLENILKRMSQRFQSLYSSHLILFKEPQSGFNSYLISFQTEHSFKCKSEIYPYIEWPYFCFSPPTNISDYLLSKFKFFDRNVDLDINWSTSKIKTNKNHVDWESLLQIRELTQQWESDHTIRIPEKEFGIKVAYPTYDDGLMKLLDVLNWTHLSINKDIPWSLAVLEIFEKRWDWKWISANSSIPFDNEILRRFKRKIDWGRLSGIKAGFWTAEILAEFWQLLDWTKLSQNESLPWSIQFIERFKNRWDWSSLSTNENLPWCSELFLAFKERWIFVAPHKYSEETYNDDYDGIFVSGLAGNPGFYQGVVLPLFDHFDEWLNNEIPLNRKRKIYLYPANDPDRKYFSLNEPFDFGKYKGKTLKEIIDLNISYAIWAIGNVVVTTDQEGFDYLISSLYNVNGIQKYCPELDVFKDHRKAYIEDYGLRCHQNHLDSIYEDDDYDHSFRDYGYDSWDDMNFEAGFDGDIDAWNHYNE